MMRGKFTNRYRFTTPINFTPVRKDTYRATHLQLPFQMHLDSSQPGLAAAVLCAVANARAVQRGDAWPEFYPWKRDPEAVARPHGLSVESVT